MVGNPVHELLLESARAPLRAAAQQLFAGMLTLGAPLPPAVKELQSMYEPMLLTEVYRPLTVLAAVRGSRDSVPRQFVFRVSSAEEGLHFAQERTQAVLLPRPEYSALVGEMDAVLDELKPARGLSVWTMFLPSALAPGADANFLGLGLARDSDGRAGAFLVTDETFQWLGLEGLQLEDTIQGALAFGVVGAAHLMQDALSRDLCRETAAALAQAGVTTKESALQEAVRELWAPESPLRDRLNKYLWSGAQLGVEEAHDLLLSVTAALAASRKLEADAYAKGKKEGERAARRLSQEKERLQMAYDGLKQRASRQEALIVQLRRVAASASTAEHANEAAAVEQKSFVQAIRQALALTGE